MKNLLVISTFSLTLCSCSLFRQPAASPPARQQKDETRFLENISIRSNSREEISKPGTGSERYDSLRVTPGSIDNNPETWHNLQFKYAILLDIPVEEMTDAHLIEFLESWYGTRYKMGGTTQEGVDCSAFVQTFMMSMYGVELPRTSKEQYQQASRISKKELTEGDLVFFHTGRKRGISHVGIYLRNNKFVHASTSSGVMISDLSEDYYRSRYVGSGRYRNKNYSTSSY
jgi:lipoprotein Spr